MIFHIPTRTAIFTPPKTGSVSLHSMARETPGFITCHGPCECDSKKLTPHVASHDVDRIDDYKIEHRVLLMREPGSRIVSLWRHLFARGETQDTFSNWVASFNMENTGSGGWIPMQRYCEKPDQVIRLEFIHEDLFRLFDIKVSLDHKNESTVQRPVPTFKDGLRIRSFYDCDFRMWESFQ